MCQHSIDVRSDILSVNQDLSVLAVPQRDMKDSAVLREVYFLSREHGIASVFHFSGSCELEEKLKALGIDAVFGVVKENVAIFGGGEF